MIFYTYQYFLFAYLYIIMHTSIQELTILLKPFKKENMCDNKEIILEESNTLEVEQKLEWTRSEDGVIAGVCAGLSKQLDIDVNTLRILWIVSVIFGFGILAYLALWISFPKESRFEQAQQPMVFGVCQRVSEKYQMNTGLVRLITLLLIGVSFGATLVGYIVLHITLPSHKEEFS